MAKAKKTVTTEVAPAEIFKVKASHQPIYDQLMANQSRIDPEVFPGLIELCYGKAKQIKNILDRSNNQVAVVCWYFKRWMPLVGPRAVDFPSNKSQVHGLNKCCREGNKFYQQRLDAFNAVNTVVENETRLINQKLRSQLDEKERSSLSARLDELDAMMAEAEEAKTVIKHTHLGFETMEECMEYLVENGTDFVAPHGEAE